jgi:hypothetical protein
MKTKILILAALLVMSTGTMIAGIANHIPVKPSAARYENISMVINIASRPIFAEFTDGTDAITPAGNLVDKIAPVTPKEAEFEETETAVKIDLEKLRPGTPMETEFEEADSLESPPSR